jgi:hypothetical protein
MQKNIEMMPDFKPQTQNITPHAERLLNILRENGGYMTRGEISDVLGKTKLNKWEVALLEMLEGKGMIISLKRPVPGGIKFAWAHKAVANPGS